MNVSSSAGRATLPLNFLQASSKRRSDPASTSRLYSKRLMRRMPLIGAALRNGPMYMTGSVSIIVSQCGRSSLAIINPDATKTQYRPTSPWSLVDNCAVEDTCRK